MKRAMLLVSVLVVAMSALYGAEPMQDGHGQGEMKSFIIFQRPVLSPAFFMCYSSEAFNKIVTKFKELHEDIFTSHDPSAYFSRICS